MLKYCIAAFFIISCKSHATNKGSTVNKIIAVANIATPNQQTDIENNKEGIIKIAKVKLQIDSIKNAAAEGDIIFRGGTDIESNIIRDFSNADKLFSHCGIILKNDGGLGITHILGGTTNPDGGILTQPVEDFLLYPDNESAGIYSIALSAKQLYKLYHFIDSVQKQKVTFDLHFNLFTKQQLYCTELVIDALSYARGNKNLFSATKFNLKNTKYFFLNNDGHNFLFYPIDVFQHNRLLKPKGVFYFPNYHP